MIEGTYSGEATHGLVKEYLHELAKFLGMRIQLDPVTFSANKFGHPVHNGVNGFVSWVESGCHIYMWESCKFFTADIYSCKSFDAQQAADFTKNFLKAHEVVFKVV